MLCFATLLISACQFPVHITITVGRENAAAQALPTATPSPRSSPTPTPTPRAVATATRKGAIPTALVARLRTAPPNELQIPRLGLDAPVTSVASTVDHGQWYWPVPEHALGHLLGTANPGEPGNIAISGHVDTRTGPGLFARLGDVRPGDLVIVRSADGVFTYRVIDVTIVPEDDRTILRQTPQEQLTLITCLPDGQYHRRIVVRAQRVESAA
ncbi:sortase [Thermorudis peleae]|uniref:sortase n=1 Tax=Thermorudis peleae TaxID=1382356 RepID=UPI00068B1D2A|nr:class D sortase [Thermorudis peleae]